MVNKNAKIVQSLQRGLFLFEAICRRKEGITLKELAKVIDCSAPATYHLVHTLVACGYVRRKENPVRYVMGEKCLQLARGQEQDHFYKVVFAQIEDLIEKLPGVEIYFSEHVGGDVVVTAYTSPKSGGQLAKGGDRRLPPFVSAGSLVHLALEQGEVRDEYEARYPFDAYGLPFWKSRSAFDAAVQALRENGYHFVPENSPLRLKLALPVYRNGGSLGGALTVQWNHQAGADMGKLRDELLAVALSAGERIAENLEGEEIWAL